MRAKAGNGWVTKSVVGRLARDERGNVLIISAVAIIPMLAMIGGAIDASRLYMARSRLQQACDAGALAGRKAMADQQELTPAESATAKSFFDFNFPTGTYEASNIVANYVRGTKIGTVVGNASIVMPTTMMQLFGYATVPMSVACESTLSIPNTDVMFVLDVTGSMLQTPSGDTQTRLGGLKQAVGDFYAALGPGTATGAGRIRYGFMPYSSNVNVGKIVYNLNHSYIVGGTGPEKASYRSRNYNLTSDYFPDYGTESGQTAGGSSDSQIMYNNNYTYLGQAYGGYPETTPVSTVSTCSSQTAPKPSSSNNGSASTSGPADEAVIYPDNTQTRTYTTTQPKTSRRYRYSGTSSSCRLQYDDGTYTTTSTSTSTRPVTWKKKFASWTYKSVDIDVSQVVQNGTAANPTYFTGFAPDTTPNMSKATQYSKDDVPTPTTITWDGCIEEAKTVNTITASSSLNVPSGANDLKIDLIPSDIETRWKPFLPAVQYDANGLWLGRQAGWISLAYAVCPREASPLTQYQSDYDAGTKTSASFSNYVNSLAAVGGTYHDIGLIWGARFLSPDGIYSATNNDAVAPGGFQVSRHIVFMTDGELDTRPAANDPWGVNTLEGRVAPNNTSKPTFDLIHQRRTSIICNAMKAKGFTVWVVGLGITTMPAELQQCATDAAHWSLAKNAATLRAEFQKIAQTIGGLRLSS